MQLEITNVAALGKDNGGGKTGTDHNLDEFSTNSDDVMGQDEEVKDTQEKMEKDNAKTKQKDGKMKE
eukprot:4849492-Ditylum_brightwellii.AAC.1